MEPSPTDIETAKRQLPLIPLGIIKKQGAKLEFKSNIRMGCNTPPAKRGTITTFSRASRLRMYKFLAGIDWDRIHASQLLTWTYPDLHTYRTSKQRSMDRYLIMRHLEAHLNRHLCGLWRWEWIDRKSGKRIGEFCPHLHVVVFDLPYIDYGLCRRWWREILKERGYVDFWGEQVPSGQNASFYVAKYCAKVVCPSSLGICAYHNSQGRHWGYLRVRMIPRFEILWCRDPDESQIMRLLTLARTLTPWIDQRNVRGFTLLGDYAQQATRLLAEMGLTMHTEE